MDGLRRDIYIILIPHMVSDGFKSQYPPPIDNQKMESIKLFSSQINFLIADTYRSPFQAEIQIAFPDFRQGLVRQVLLFLEKGGV